MSTFEVNIGQALILVPCTGLEPFYNSQSSLYTITHIMAEPPSVQLSFANNFWGKEDAGVSPLLDRMHNAKVTGDELKAFYTGMT
jgi:hypothetical protein